MKTNLKFKKFSLISILISVSLILGYVDSLIEFNVGIVGLRVGIANIVTLIAFKSLDLKSAFLINVIRVIILNMIFGNTIRFVISASGFLLSFMVMSLLFYRLRFSIITTSIFGGVTHNIGQILSALILVNNVRLVLAAPLFTLVGILTGLVIGVLSTLIINKISNIVFE